MKWSTRILLTIFFALVAGLVASNIVLKKKYDKVDKSDVYWNYARILEKPFKYLKIEGGNITTIAFEQNANCSVRVLELFERHNPNFVTASVKNDTLFVVFPEANKNRDDKDWLKYMTIVRIAAPELLSVEGFDTKLEMYKMKQKSITVSMSGKSTFELESLIPHFDSLIISQRDSSEVVFEMSPEYKLAEKSTTKIEKKRVSIGAGSAANIFQTQAIKNPESIMIESVEADLRGLTLLDLGHAQIKSLKLSIADSSAIILSGGALRKVGKTESPEVRKK